MKLRIILGLSPALVLCALSLHGQEANPTNQLQHLEQQVRQLQQSFEQMQAQYRQQIHAMQKQIDALQKTPPPPATDAPTSVASAPPPSATRTEPASTPPVRAPWRPSDPIRVGGSGAYLDVGLVGTIAIGGSTASDIEGGTQTGGHDPYQRGFNIQGIELSLRGSVDPYFRANANIVYSINSAGESFLELEEGWMETLSLPANLQLRVGQILTEFGRQNPTHVHTWSFVDAPLVNGRFLGADGLRNPGARLSWLAPTPFYSELIFGIQNSHGETAEGFRSAGHTHGGGEAEALPFAYRHTDNDRGLKTVGGLLFSPRYAMSFDLTPNQVLLLGASAALGPNSSGASGDTDTQIYGVDLTWKWKSPRHHAGFPFLVWQTEGMLRKYDAGAFDWDENGNGLVDDGEVADLSARRPAQLPRERLTDYGLYSQFLYGFTKGWVAGVRFDYVAGDKAAYEGMDLDLDGRSLGRDPLRAQRWRFSPNLTWYPSEYSKIRLQYNYDDRRGVGADHSLWLQMEFLIGAHAAHKF